MEESMPDGYPCEDWLLWLLPPELSLTAIALVLSSSRLLGVWVGAGMCLRLPNMGLEAKTGLDPMVVEGLAGETELA